MNARLVLSGKSACAGNGMQFVQPGKIVRRDDGSYDIDVTWASQVGPAF